ncbi:acyltransferase family protein [Desertimonas flava]|uniref:acyltransferase family protein n=1 Tax=Desertimonas flava TaxID=2064846 RepID=UPI000E3456A3|nr:acyltransferase [Desertimonas flava]
MPVVVEPLVVTDAAPVTTAWQRDRPLRVEAFLGFTSGPRVAVQEGLNGVRGMAVIPVVAFHLGYSNLLGGAQLVMSLFFTQSGFLIATLILHEYDRTGAFRLGPFWAARARRILPPAWLTIAAVGLVRLLTDSLPNPDRLDLVTAFAHVSNWYLYFSDAITDAVVEGRSSVLNHFWSLSVEEQFYVFIAFVSLWLFRTKRRPLIVLRWIALVGMTASFLLPFVFDMGEERVFYGTDARAGELLIGVAMATFIVSRPVREGMLRHRWPIVAASAGALVTAWVLFHYARPRTGMLENGLLPVGSVLWVLVIVGAMLPDGPVAWLMHGRLLRWLGQYSYGIYAYHFPVLTVARFYLDVHPLLLTAIVVAITLALAMASYRYVEIPIRRQRLRGRPLAVGAAVVLATIVVTTALT